MKIKSLLIVAGLFAATLLGAQEAEKVYGIKSGIVTSTSDMMGQAVTQLLYFDDYGVKQVTVSDFGGQKMRMLRDKDGSQIMVNDAEKSATKMPAFGGGSNNNINWLNLTEKVVKDNKIKELGEETIAGKTCKKYKYRVGMMGQFVNQTVWVYEGIVLKSSSSTQMGDMVQTATKVEENVTIEPSMFVIPEGVKVEEFDMNGFGGGF